MRRRVGCGAQEVLEERQVDDHRGEAEFEGDAPEQQPIGEHANGAQGGAFGAGRERGADLAHHHAQEGHGDGLLVGVVERVPRADGITGMPARVDQT